MSTIRLTHNPPLPKIRLYTQSAFTHNPPFPTIRLYPQSGYNQIKDGRSNPFTTLILILHMQIIIFSNQWGSCMPSLMFKTIKCQV